MRAIIAATLASDLAPTMPEVRTRKYQRQSYPDLIARWDAKHADRLGPSIARANYVATAGLPVEGVS